jgi:hypothetical protein
MPTAAEVEATASTTLRRRRPRPRRLAHQPDAEVHILLAQRIAHLELDAVENVTDHLDPAREHLVKRVRGQVDGA